MSRVRFPVAATLAAVVVTVSPSRSARALQAEDSIDPSVHRVPIDGALLYARSIGRGQPLIVLHGGPDFDHRYLLPELDRLKDAFRLIYYDQRGRGRSADHVRPEDVSLVSDLDDIDRVRRHFGLDAPALLAHSWGTVLALEYALRHPTRVSHLVLMNPAPASASDIEVMRRAYLEKLGADMAERQADIVASAAYQAGDPEAGILKARAVEEQLYRDTWQVPDYDLLPKLRDLNIPTLIIAGDHDFIPVDVAERIAQAFPNATLVTLEDCGHFAYLECAGRVRRALDDFFRRTDETVRAQGPG